MKEKLITNSNNFNIEYEKEKLIREKIDKKLTTELKDTQFIKTIGELKYYSKEFIFQKKDEETLKKWKYSIDTIYEPSVFFLVEDYKDIVEQIALLVFNEVKNNEKINKSISNINSFLNTNKKINYSILRNLDNISKDFVTKTQVTSIFIIIILIIVIIYLSKKVNFIVDKSVSEIEKEIENGIAEIDVLNKEIEDTQKEVIFTMGAIGETRSKETGNHVKRVAEYSKLLAKLYGLSDEEAEMIKLASPMHDIGKVAIPDSILNKPGKFTEEERIIMNEHAKIGYEMLKHSNRPILKTAAIVAYEHHEKWDGSGYPRGLKGEDIHIFGRITALADVFDALGSDRCYKKAWEDERIFKMFKEQSGKHFDPKLIHLFFENLDKFYEIRNKFID